jgi:hypothetical protein
MEVFHPELHKVINDLNLAQESRNLLFATLVGKGGSHYDALRLIWVLIGLRAGATQGLILLQKTELLENLLNLMRQGQKDWVSKVCYILYEGNLPLGNASSFLPEGMISQLLRWVNAENAEKVREILWAILLRKEIGLAAFAKIVDVAAGFIEKDPITRNNVIRFLFDHFSPDEVVESVFQYSMASGKRIPGVAFRRYVSLLNDQEGLQEKKYILEKILSSAKLDDKEINQILSDYMNSLNRFDLIRLLSSSDSSPPRIAELKRKGKQMNFFLNLHKTNSPHHDGFRERISKLLCQSVGTCMDTEKKKGYERVS